MKTLVLVLASRTAPYPALVDAIKRTWAAVPVKEAEVLFYYGDDELAFIDPDLYLPVADDLRHVGQKTIACFEYVLAHREFDLVFRTNCSTYVDLPNLVDFVRREADPTRYYAGKGVNFAGIDFAGGSGYFLSRDLVELTVDKQTEWDHHYLDDVALGKLLRDHGVERRFAPRVIVQTRRAAKRVDLDQFHFRCRTDTKERRGDIEIMTVIHAEFTAARQGRRRHGRPRVGPGTELFHAPCSRLSADRFVRVVGARASAAAGALIVLLGTPRVRRRAQRRRRLPVERTDPISPLFGIHTFVTDEAQYEQMRSSFAEAGMSPPLAEFERLADARHGGASDPYSVITKLGSDPGSRYPILCHQDVRLDRGAGASDLLKALQRLDELDPDWVVAGNAGGTRELGLVRRLADPLGESFGESFGPLPVRVVALDENFLVLNGRRCARCSPGLAGFHFYGADVCLNAMSDGGAAYVIDFPMSHLSPGVKDADFVAARDRFREAWNARHLFLYLNTASELLFLSRSRLLRRTFGSPTAIRGVRRLAASYRRRRDRVPKAHRGREDPD